MSAGSEVQKPALTNKFSFKISWPETLHIRSMMMSSRRFFQLFQSQGQKSVENEASRARKELWSIPE
jgi:hypothetical protein